MSKHLDEAITLLKELPEEQQMEIAALLRDYRYQQEADIDLTPEQIAEIEKALSDDEPYATDEEVRAFFARSAG